MLAEEEEGTGEARLICLLVMLTVHLCLPLYFWHAKKEKRLRSRARELVNILDDTL